MSHPDRHPPSLAFLFWLFLKLGATAFGGFMALLSVIENLVVTRHQLLTHEDILDGLSLASILPGPVAIDVVAYIGYRLRGWIGAVVTTFAVLLPSFVLVVCLSVAYLQMGEIPAVDRAFQGFIPPVVAIIFNAAWRTSRKIIKSWQEVTITAVAIALLNTIGGFYITIIVVIGSGVMGWLWFDKFASQQNAELRTVQQIDRDDRELKGIFRRSLALSKQFRSTITIVLLLIGLAVAGGLLQPWLDEDSLAKLWFTFSGMSLTLFGGGYVFIPSIQELVVQDYNWVTQTQFANAIAIGQLTPGPILISVAFIGYAVRGVLGAAVATASIFAPPAILMVACSHVLEQIKRSAAIQAALKGLRPAIIGTIFTAAIVIAQTATIHWATPLIFALSLTALWQLKLPVVLIIPGAGILGVLLY